MRARPFWEAPEAGAPLVPTPPACLSLCPGQGLLLQKGSHACWLQLGPVPLLQAACPGAGSFRMTTGCTRTGV